jgi:hypothetical protein
LNLQAGHKRHVLHLVNWQTDIPAEVEFRLPAGSLVGLQAKVVWPRAVPLAATTRKGERTYTFHGVGPHVVAVFE